MGVGVRMEINSETALRQGRSKEGTKFLTFAFGKKNGSKLRAGELLGRIKTAIADNHVGLRTEKTELFRFGDED